MGYMIKLPAILTRFSRRADRTCNLTFETQEVSSDELKEFDEHYQKFGWLLFSEAEIQEEEIPKGDPELSSKSQAQRIRNVLYKLYLQDDQKLEFKDYYKEKTEKYIEHLKGKILQ